uniref:amino acid adenylation domain-containing protein n=1 Tax=Andreprevotia chitinilytica TaxID=396808 RepID=UPI0005513680
QGDTLQTQVDFWQQHLTGAPALLDLPTDRPRPAVQSYAGGQVALNLSPTLTAGLKQLSQRHGTTLFMTLLAGWSVLLSRWSGQNDVVIGTPVANRQRSELEGLMGFFVNTLALRVKLDGNPKVDELLNQIKTNTIAAYAHQDLPFEQVVEALQPTRSLSHSPLFQVMLVLNNIPVDGELSLPGLTLSEVAQARDTAHFDLSLSLTDTATGLVGSLAYASDLFDRSTIERLLSHFETVLAGMVQDDQQAIGQLPLQSAAERLQILVDFNATAASYPSDQLIHQLFEQQAAQQPDAIAVVFENQQLSYGELNRRANQLAHHLIALGVQPDDRVALSTERSLDLVIGLLGILKAGGAYVPLDPDYPVERLAYMLADSQPVVLVTQAALLATLSMVDVPVVALDVETALVNQPTANPVVADLTSRQLAYVIYTSGSTGQPKGVMVEHHSVINLWVALDKLLAQPSGQQMAVAMNASLVFDASVKSWSQLLSGHRLVLIPSVIRTDGLALWRFLADGQVDVFDCTPMQLEWLLTAGLTTAAGYQPKQVLIGGEAISVGVWNKLACSSRTDFYNVYGPTECTVDASATRIGPGRPHIGRPIANVRIYLLDLYGQPVPIGVAGELYIGGAGVARGYLNRPELTAERFVGDPFSADPAARLYKTGDLGRWLPNGHIEYLGRNDFQVKIRGFRIELGEIEAQLTACVGVREAVVIAREDQPGDQRLVAYLIPQDGIELSAADLRQQLSQSLADYMLPSAFVSLESFPLTPNGKLDRKALPAPDQSSVVSREYAAPQGEIETIIATIWQDLLGLERVGRHDQFFELGGHSLLAVQLVSRLRQVLGLELPLRELFAQPTVLGLASVLAQAAQSTQAPIPLADRAQALPLSWPQQRLWFVTQLDANAGAAFHMPAGLRLYGELNRLALRATLDRIVARHEALRTCFIADGGEAAQMIAPADCGFSLQEHDLRGLTESDRSIRVEQFSQAEAVQPFDLATGPLIRGQLLQLADDDYLLLITQHHIISDGWSIGVLVREVSALYTAFSQGQADPLPPLEIQYPDYAVWQRQWLQGEVLQSQRTFWRDHLLGAPALLELPTDRPRPAVQSYRGSTLALTLPPALTVNLKQLSQRHGTTLFMTLLAGWSVLLSRLSGQDDVVIGTPVANRPRTELEGLIGFFVNTLALRVRFDEQPSVQTLLQQVKASTLAAYGHQDLPFEQVVDALQPPRSLSHSPLFQSLFTLNNTPQGQALGLPGLTLQVLDTPHHTTQFDLSLSLHEDGTGLVGQLQYATDLFDAETIARLAAHFEIVLTGMVDNDQQAISRLPLLTMAQQQHITHGFNTNQADYPHEALMQQLFEQYAEQQPDATALIFEDQTLSYGELNRRANQLAHHLIGLGIRPDDRVALCIERSLDMIIGLLGILKAGGAYVPLDPAYPAERLAYMLSDSQPVVLVTQAALRETLPAIDVPMVALDAEAALVDQATSNPVLAGLTSHHLAYVIYTSGSTGQPKGVMVEHRGVCSLASAQRTAFEVRPDSRVLQFASLSFDASLFEVTLALCCGAVLVVAPKSALMPGVALQQTLHHQRITHVTLPASALNAWATPTDLPPLSLIVAGEALPPALARRWARHHQLFNGYGPTETTVCAAIHPCDAEAAPSASVPIGKPFTNVRIYLLDAHRQPVPLGVVGEIHIGGVGGARGDLHRPELTAERFVPDPFNIDPTARMYKTGDLGRWLPDGSVEYAGRNDFQVKIRGFRIELGEIEAKLTACAGVREAAVIAREDVPGEKRLVAYVVPQAGVGLIAATLRQQLSQSLADHMLPSAFVSLDSLPLTPNGKLDRKALPVPDQSSVISRAYEAPQGEVEQTIAAVWQNLLGLERVGRHDQFFELGGHSLLAVQLVSRLRDVLGLEIPVSQLFAYPTVSGIAAAQARAGSIRHPNLAAVRTDGAKRPLFLIHPIRGEVGYANDIAPWIDSDIPIYGFSAIGLLTGETPLNTIQAMAEQYVQGIRHIQPEGPYRIAGWSAGGSIAYEIANQLINTGAAVEFLGLIDTTAQHRREFDGAMPPIDDISTLLLMLPVDLPDDVRDEMALLAEKNDFDTMVDRLYTYDLIPQAFNRELLLRYLAVIKGIRIALHHYCPPVLPVNVTLYSAKAEKRRDISLGWGNIMPNGQLQVIPVSGSHHSMMQQPHICQLGREISAAIVGLEVSI